MPDRTHILVRKTLDGDTHAFGDLVERYGPLVRGTLVETVRRPDEIDDLSQEVFCKAYQQLPALRQPAQFASWLARITSRVATDWFRRRRAETQAMQAAHHAGLHLHHPQPPDESLESGETIALLWAALDRLPPELRRLLVLFHLEGCPQREIAHFLGLSLTTVKWRLRKARKLLRLDLAEAIYREATQHPETGRRLREKVMSVVPFTPFLAPRPHPGWFGPRLGLAILGVVALLGGLGIVFHPTWLPPVWDNATNREGGGGFHVRYAPRPLPALSFLWEPRNPHPGESMRIEVAGLEAPPGERLFLHYLTDSKHPLDRVVAMAPQRESYEVEIPIPADAASIFFYVSAEEEPQNLQTRVGPTAWERNMRRYRWSCAVHDTRDRPVLGAALARAQMAWWQGAPYGEIMAHWDREIARFPDHSEPYVRRLATMLWHGDWSVAVRDEAQAEREALRGRFADQPDFLWWLAQLPGLPADEQLAAYRDLYQRFPDHERADEAAYRTVRGHWPVDTRQNQPAALEAYLRSFPESPCLHKAHQDLLHSLLLTEPQRAARLADSLITGSLVVAIDPQRDAVQSLLYPGVSGICPEGTAYSVRFDLFLQQRDPQAALDLARRLVDSGLQDPLPYLYIGQRLAGQASWLLVDDDSLTPPRDGPLAIKLLAAALPWTQESHWTDRAVPKSQQGSLGAAQDGDPRRWLGWARRWHVSCLRSLGASHLDQARFRQALAYLEEAATLARQSPGYATDHAEIHLLLGTAYEELGEEEKAREADLQAMQAIYRSASSAKALQKRFERRYGNAGRLRHLLHSLHPPAPPVVLTDLQDRPVHLSDFRGRPVLLCYIRRDSTQAERLRTLAAWQSRFGDELEILGVLEQVSPWERSSRDAALHGWAQDNGGLRVLVDDGSVYDRYRPEDFTLFLIDQQGCLRLRQDRSRAEFIEHGNGFVRRERGDQPENEPVLEQQIAQQIERLLAEDITQEGDAGAEDTIGARKPDHGGHSTLRSRSAYRPIDLPDI